LSTLRSFGYSIGHKVVSAADFGVPQNRKRLIVLGIEGNRPVRFPLPSHGTPDRPFRSVSEAIDDLPDAGEFGETGVFNHEPTAHSTDMTERLSRLGVGKRERGSFHDRLHPDRPSYTLRAGSGNFSPWRPVHYRYHRVITVRESARIQGFTDDLFGPTGSRDCNSTDKLVTRSRHRWRRYSPNAWPNKWNGVWRNLL
jgi:DNA (cytosine-5)-methyltransferase 1